MSRIGIRAASLGMAAVFLFASLALGQANPTGTLAGTVTDSSHAVVPGATVRASDAATGIKLQTTTGANGHYSIGNVAPGVYAVTVTAKGFQSAAFQAVTIVASQVYTLNAVLSVGEVTSSVTVEAGQQVLETQQTSVGDNITGAMISELPSASSASSLYSLTQTDPAIQTMGAPRQSSAEGLPGGAINITIDGISAQWEAGKSGDPVFTMISPNVSDTAEFDLTSAAGSSAQSGEGAVQINLISKRGTDQWHGSVYDYFRNDALNSNYYFNNLAGQKRPVMRFNQWGFSLGGPILKDKLFFFFDLSKFGQPEGSVQSATVLSPQAAQGLFTYAPVTPPASANPNAWTTCGATTCTANLLAMAQNFGQPSAIDSFVGQTLGTLAKASSAPGVTAGTPPSLYQQEIEFPLSGKNQQQNPDFRLDYNLSQNHSFEFDYHLSRLIIFPDDLNGGGYTYPVAPFNGNQYGYAADRAIWAWAWRWNLGPTQSNELRYGFQQSPEEFNYNQTTDIYPTISTNLGSIRMQPVFPGEVTNPWHGYGTFQDHDDVHQLSDNFAWVKGNHNMSYGFTLTRARFRDLNSGNVVAAVNLGLSGFEPMASDINNTNLPGIAPNDQTAAGDIYGLLTGNVVGYSGSVAFDPAKRQFVTGIPGRDNYHQTDLGFYGNDSWRVRPNLTFNYGLRWQYEGAPVDDLSEYFIAAGGAAAAYGVSGPGNLFKPGTLTGAVPTFVNDQGKPWYNNWYKGFAPSIGLAWQPEYQSGVMRAIFGNPGESVFRAGYSIAYSREGLNNWSSISQGNPGYFGSQFATAAPATGGGQPAGFFNAGTVQISSMNISALAQSPATFQSSFAIDPASNNNAVNVIDPNLHMPYVQSWTFGIQRSLGRRTALEIRYVGNHAAKLWQQQNLNEVNIFENGFLQEFKNAQGNLAACKADAGCSAAPSFADRGLPGQVPLPIFTAAFNGPGSDAANAATQKAAAFSSGRTIAQLQNGQAGSAASQLATTYNYWQNLIAAGYPKNLFLVNPDAIGGSFLLHNALDSTYNALVVAVRRRPIHGLTLNASYTWSKSLTDDWQRNGANYTDIASLRDPGYNQGPAPFDIRNAFKLYSLWDLPFGRGQRWANGGGFVNALAGGWQFGSNILLQSGRPGLLTGGLGGTFDQYDGGVILHGMSQSQLQSQLGVYKTSSPAPGAVWYFPQSMLSRNGRPDPSVLEACNTPGQLCQRMFIYDAPLFLPDFSFIKHTQITERVTSEIQVQFLNAFNNANFFWTGSAQTFGTARQSLNSSSFGRITHAYQAVDSTADHGGRTIQLVAKFSF